MVVAAPEPKIDFQQPSLGEQRVVLWFLSATEVAANVAKSAFAD
jgi:hypothetical protein